METLYVLQCEDDKWYVGKTSDITRRFKQHQDGKGSVWTKEYKPIRIAETRPITSSHDETNLTKDYMKKYGIDNVRGGAYSQLEIPNDIETLIKHELKANTDSCYKCGKKGHFANKCPKREEEVVWECNYCEEQFNTESSCEKHEKYCSRKPNRFVRGFDPESKNTCYRCGRSGHWAPDCYARTHRSGYALD